MGQWSTLSWSHDAAAVEVSQPTVGIEHPVLVSHPTRCPSACSLPPVLCPQHSPSRRSSASRAAPSAQCYPLTTQHARRCSADGWIPCSASRAGRRSGANCGLDRAAKESGSAIGDRIERMRRAQATTQLFCLQCGRVDGAGGWIQTPGRGSWASAWGWWRRRKDVRRLLF
jgi:hypothetical protein